MDLHDFAAVLIILGSIQLGADPSAHFEEVELRAARSTADLRNEQLRREIVVDVGRNDVGTTDLDAAIRGVERELSALQVFVSTVDRQTRSARTFSAVISRPPISTACGPARTAVPSSRSTPASSSSFA